MSTCAACTQGPVHSVARVLRVDLNATAQIGTAVVETTGGRRLTVPLSSVPAPILRPYAEAAGVLAPRNNRTRLSAGDLSDLVTDIQQGGRDWLFAQIQALSTLGVRWAEQKRVADEMLHDATATQQAADAAAQVSHVRDDLYWVVDTYLGGIDSLPNQGVFVGPPVQAGAKLGAVQLAIVALGIVTGAALLAYIASQIRAHSEFKLRMEAALQTQNPEQYLPPAEQDTPGIVDQVKSGVGTVVTFGVLAAAGSLFWPEIKAAFSRARSRAKGAA